MTCSPALPRRSQGQEIERLTAGVRVASDTVLMLADVCGDILRHELTHVVTDVAGEGPYGKPPRLAGRRHRHVRPGRPARASAVL